MFAPLMRRKVDDAEGSNEFYKVEQRLKTDSSQSTWRINVYKVDGVFAIRQQQIEPPHRRRLEEVL
jgi:hypothetical protein